MNDRDTRLILVAVMLLFFAGIIPAAITVGRNEIGSAGSFGQGAEHGVWKSSVDTGVLPGISPVGVRAIAAINGGEPVVGAEIRADTKCRVAQAGPGTRNIFARTRIPTTAVVTRVAFLSIDGCL